MPPEIFADLNDEQRRAVEATRGPVCILAGAGSGKTTTITRRIANQVVSGEFQPEAILAVAFTDRAAGEMRDRLEELGIEGVRARTFHSAALAQLRALSQDAPATILPSKAQALRQIANKLPKPYNFRPAADLATEIEWAKNRRISPDAYESSLTDEHQPPIPADLMVKVYKRYEDGKRERGMIDFEDLLELSIRMFQSDEYARERFAARYQAFTVDEYQDVNLLQETLLTEWIGEGDDLCVVGDDYQSIYGFTGASPDYLLAMPTRFPNTKVIRLETNYRSTSQVLTVANRLVPKLGGAEKVLRAVTDDGPEPRLRPFTSGEGELRALVQNIIELHGHDVPYDEMAILYRVNFRSEDYEEALSAAQVPYQVTDGAFLNRQTARQMIAALKNSDATRIESEVRKHALRAGWLVEIPDDLGEAEATRQNDLTRFVKFANEFEDGTRTAADLIADLQLRFGGGGKGRGVNLLTLHRAKGLEFDAVFLPRLEEGELPFKRSLKAATAIGEERRLFYVGITRAKTHLAITWVNDGKRKPSRFIGELKGNRGARMRGPGLTVPKRRQEELVAELDLSIKLQGGYVGRIVEIDDDEVTIELSNGAQMGVAYGSLVTNRGETLPLARPPTVSAR
ncbi:MAG TPA: UvrD-helicase domain-containing protein [Actinomycetota bacterium]|nr:UvrD-helicase domain-containing protein [Actinomycetota bacterium]